MQGGINSICKFDRMLLSTGINALEIPCLTLSIKAPGKAIFLQNHECYISHRKALFRGNPEYCNTSMRFIKFKKMFLKS